MAINLSDLTGASTSGDILAEAQSTADFLDSVPLLKNLSDPSGATDAKQFTATKQPKALPLIDGDGYLYLSGVSGNYASVPNESALDITGDIDIRVKATIVNLYPTVDNEALYTRYASTPTAVGISLWRRQNNGKLGVVVAGANGSTGFIDAANVTWSEGDTLWFRAVIDVGVGNYDVDLMTSADGGNWTTIHSETVNGTYPVSTNNNDSYFGRGPSGDYFKGAIHNVQVYASVDGTDKRLDVDFTAPHIRHGDTAFECATGQVVTINQSGNDPATIIKKPVLRFDGVDDFMNGVFGQTIDSGYMFAAFTVLGDGGESSGRVLSVNATGQLDWLNGGVLFSGQNGTSDKLSQYVNGWRANHVGLFEDDNGDILHESLIESGNQLSRVNNADEASTSITYTVSAEEFNIGGDNNGNSNSAIDLEYLALFDATITDSQADSVRNYINNRNNVFYRWDTDGYYFFDPQSLADGGVLSWNGRIVGSDNGDADLLAAQSTSADRPTKSGLSVTFADNTDHLTIPSTTQAGWQVVGTSLGTFAYKVDADAITELNLLGNLGGASFRFSGDLYGIILLPTSATGKDINEAKKLLTDRGASGTASSFFQNAWRERRDIVQFDGGDMSDVSNVGHAWLLCSSLTSFNSELPSATSVTNAWRNCSSLTSFSTALPSVTNASYAWNSCSSLSDFRTTDIKNCSNFTSAWHGCSALQSFPENALLGTEATNVTFESAWQSSGLTSFNTPLPTATNVSYAWYGCSSLTSFSSELPSATTVNQAWRSCVSLESFSTSLPSATNANAAWYGCSSLESFSTSLPLADIAAYGWRYCSSLTDFSADVFSNWNPSSISSGVFNQTWANCTSLTAQSVENILVSIAASGKYATSTGLSGGSALADATIDIDYDVSTGSLTAATTSAITTLKSRGWGININNVLQ